MRPTRTHAFATLAAALVVGGVALPFASELSRAARRITAPPDPGGLGGLGDLGGPGGALGAYLMMATGAPAGDAPPPSLYLELFDLSRLERTLESSGLGRLLGRVIAPQTPAPAAGGGPWIQRLGRELGAWAGERSWEDTLALALYDLGREHLGLERREALEVAASLGARFSLALDPLEERAAVSWSLRSGGDRVLKRLLDERLSELDLGGVEGALALVRQPPRADAGDGTSGPVLYALDSRLVRMERGEGGLYFAVLPDLFAVTNDLRWAEVLTGAWPEAAGPEVADFSKARAKALARSGDGGPPVWSWFDGRLFDALELAEPRRRALAELGLDAVRSIELSLGGRDGQLATRLRVELEPGERRGLFALAGSNGADECAFEALAHVSTDAFLVAGCARAPGELGRGLARLAAEVAGRPELAWLPGRAGGAGDSSLLAALVEPGSTGEEAVFFLRPGAAGWPLGYAVTPGGERISLRLAEASRAGATGDDVSVREKALDGEPCWLLERRGLGSPGLALMQRGETLVGAPSFFAMQDLLRQQRRSGGAASAGADELQRTLAAERAALADEGGEPPRLVGFAHVRTGPLVEAVWPWVLTGLSLRGGGSAGLEDLPDAYEIAEEIGDTTLLCFDRGDAFELVGRGLLGGLGVLF